MTLNDVLRRGKFLKIMQGQQPVTSISSPGFSHWERYRMATAVSGGLEITTYNYNYTSINNIIFVNEIGSHAATSDL